MSSKCKCTCGSQPAFRRARHHCKTQATPEVSKPIYSVKIDGAEEGDDIVLLQTYTQCSECDKFAKQYVWLQRVSDATVICHSCANQLVGDVWNAAAYETCRTFRQFCDKFKFSNLVLHSEGGVS